MTMLYHYTVTFVIQNHQFWLEHIFTILSAIFWKIVLFTLFQVRTFTSCRITINLLIRMDERPNCAGGVKTLFDVQIRGRLVEHEDVSILDAHHGAGETLEFSSRQRCDLTVADVG